MKRTVKPIRQVAKQSLWTGPYRNIYDSSGVSQSMLGKFLVCPERFRLAYVEGLRDEKEYSEATEYGNMWHVCEEYHRAKKDYRKPLKDYADKLALEHPTHAEKIVHWYHTCGTQWMCYLEYEKKLAAKKGVPRTPLFQEQVFDVDILLPSGRIVRFRGKYDSVDWHGPLTKSVRQGGLYIQENKGKGSIDEDGIRSTLDNDLQNMAYLTALQCQLDKVNTVIMAGSKAQWMSSKDVHGIVYNVIRRPFSDWRGKGNIRKRKGETDKSFYGRLRDLIRADMSNYFISWKQPISASKIASFNKRTLYPILERVCDWWDSIKSNPFDPWNLYFDELDGVGTQGKPNPHHWQMPYGIFNGLADGRRGDFFEWLAKGSKFNLEQRTLFSELQE